MSSTVIWPGTRECGHVCFIHTFQSSLCAQLDFKLPSLLATGRVRLVVIDSIAALFRVEFGLNQAVHRAQLLQACGAQLQRLSESYGVAIVCINQVCTYVLPNMPLERL